MACVVTYLIAADPGRGAVRRPHDTADKGRCKGVKGQRKVNWRRKKRQSPEGGGGAAAIVALSIGS